MKKRRISLPGCALAALALFMAVGAATFLGPCVHTDGTHGACHWAGRALTGLGAVLAAQSILALILRPEDRRGVYLAMLPVVVLAALIPGNVIGLCLMETMRCRAVMQPAMILLSAAVGVWAAALAFLSGKKAKQGEKK